VADDQTGTALYNDDGSGATITGAMVKDGSVARIGLVQRRRTQRRFAAARGAYLAWSTPEKHDSRLITQAVTRDQQESRAFAAEMMAPIDFIVSRKSRFGFNPDAIDALAEELVIGADVIRHQVSNKGLSIVRA
jgi:hypothetical protein